MSSLLAIDKLKNKLAGHKINQNWAISNELQGQIQLLKWAANEKLLVPTASLLVCDHKTPKKMDLQTL